MFINDILLRHKNPSYVISHSYSKIIKEFINLDCDEIKYILLSSGISPTNELLKILFIDKKLNIDESLEYLQMLQDSLPSFLQENKEYYHPIKQKDLSTFLRINSQGKFL